MKMFLAALFTAVTVAPAYAQGSRVFLGVDDDPMLGSANAKVLIIEFGDYQCPSCRMFWKDVEPRLRKEYIDTGKVKLVFLADSGAKEEYFLIPTKSKRDLLIPATEKGARKVWDGTKPVDL